jgi:hypothetical protein
MQKHPKLSLVTILKEAPDPRMDRRKLHCLSDILGIAICGQPILTHGSNRTRPSRQRTHSRLATRPISSKRPL